MFQFIRRKDYIYGFQIRASIVFIKLNTVKHLETIKKKLAEATSASEMMIWLNIPLLVYNQ